ncbi:nicotinamide/nicotinic acid mononucleotide adenylyltransferase 3 isoform X1 [Periplaneta americana]|uniref:nicotinamide/nicotinic acid mononucleotide adenylyltransferase 3 isoform X1 n=2 Tax=Periplaneta americana TaxID=6978 RepID=UPI0037E97940
MAPPNVVLLACGAYNPPTNLHLRMFEIARDHLHRLGYHNVIGGIVSPVHDGYGKKELVSATHRCEMLRLALQNSNWIRLSDWECHQESWTRTRLVLQYHQNQLNSILNSNNESPNKRQRRDDLLWIPDDVKFHSGGPVQVKLLCGADLLESFGTPGLWTDDDIDTIVGQHGLVVITREGNNPNKFIYESDLLTKYQSNISIVTEWIANEVSSTKVRRALRRSESVKYLLQDSVIDYIHKLGLYSTKDNKYLLYPESQSRTCFLTPSPSDVNMESPSPTSNYGKYDFNETVTVEQMTSGSRFGGNPLLNGPSTYIHVENIMQERNEIESRYAERIGNEENSKRTTLSMGYPGQAVQIIATHKGNNIVHTEKGLSRPACLL